jgi:hypothetical protein
MLPKQFGNRFRWIGWKSPVRVTIAETRLISIESRHPQSLRQGEVGDQPDFVALVRIRACGPACCQKEALKEIVQAFRVCEETTYNAETAERASFDRLRMSAHGELVEPLVLGG